MLEGVDYIGVGVGAIITNCDGLLFLAKRGEHARNEQNTWEFPGGGVRFGEPLSVAIKREILEEHGMIIQIERLLGVFDHIIHGEDSHWISVTYIASHIEGEPQIREPDKCSDIGWFHPEEMPSPLSQISELNWCTYLDQRAKDSAI